MARVTVEDCLEREENRFALVVLAAQRTRQIQKGSGALVAGKNKAAVMALREIAAGKVHFSRISQEVVQEWIEQVAAENKALEAKGKLGFAGRSVTPRRPPVDRALEVGARAHFEDAAYYSKTYAARREDVAYYAALVSDTPVLEYGIGNGRIALALARNGAAVTGVDWSRPMLDDLEARLAREPADVRQRVRAVHGDMREVRVRRRFPLVLCTFNTFLHLYTRDDVERFLVRVRGHMAKGARFVFDVSVPNPEDLARDPDRAYSAPRLRHPTTGQLVKYAERFDYDPIRQILFVTIEFTPVDGAEPWVVPLAHRQFFPQELEALLHYAGFRVEDVRGGWDGEPLTRHSDVAIWTCR